MGRRIVTFNRVSADGYFASADGGLDWTVPDDEIDQAGAAAIGRYDTMLFGATTYRMFESFWPHALQATSPQDPHGPRPLSASMRAMAGWINEANKVVISKSIKQVTWHNSHLLPRFDPQQIEALKQQPGQDIIMFGSGSVASQLTQHGLIDEYQFIVGPIMLGAGRTFISEVTRRVPLALVESKAYASGNLLLRYAPRR
jgi:dihydrofolate reductase